MGLSDLSKQLDNRKQTSTKEQPYAMGRQTVRKARTDLTNKDFEASIKLKTMPAVKWLEVQFPPVFVQEINQYIDDVVIPNNKDYSDKLVGLSCILYLKVPDSIKNKPEVEVPNLNHASGVIDGWTQFQWGANTMKDIYQLREQTQHVVRPVEGKLLMFPCWLNHMVWPFKGEGERRTLSANFNIHDSPEVTKQFAER